MRIRASSRILLPVLLVLASATVAGAGTWQSVITPADQSRLDKLESAVNQGDSLALQSDLAPAEADLARLRREMQAASLPIDPMTLVGDWSCRTIKVGTILVVYQVFKCRIEATDDGLKLAKISGSQRVSALLYADTSERMIFLGHATVNDDPPAPYSGIVGARPTMEDPNRDDVVGVLSRIGEKRLRIVFPWPYYESIYDVMILAR
jgi:hypothetical protein